MSPSIFMEYWLIEGFLETVFSCWSFSQPLHNGIRLILRKYFYFNTTFLPKIFPEYWYNCISMIAFFKLNPGAWKQSGMLLQNYISAPVPLLKHERKSEMYIVVLMLQLNNAPKHNVGFPRFFDDCPLIKMSYRLSYLEKLSFFKFSTSSLWGC